MDEEKEKKPKYRGEEPKWVKESVLKIQSFESAKEAKKFLEETQRDFERLWSGSRRFFDGLSRLLDWWSRPELEAEIEYHRWRLAELEEKKRKELPE